MLASNGERAGEIKKLGDLAPTPPPGVITISLPGVALVMTAPAPCGFPNKSKSMASFNISSLRCRPNSPVPTGQNWPSMMFSLTPVIPSLSENAAASMRISTVSSNEHRINGPVSARLIP